MMPVAPTMTLALALSVSSCLACSLAAESQEDRQFKALQREMWDAKEDGKASVLKKMATLLDGFCRKTIADGTTTVLTRASLDGFYKRRSGEPPVLRAVPLDRSSWVILYNVCTHGGGYYEPILNLFTREGKKVRKKASVRLNTYKDTRAHGVPFQRAPFQVLMTIPDSAIKARKYPLLVGTTRVVTVFVIVSVNKKSGMGAIAVRSRQRTPGDPGRIRLEGKDLVVTFPEDSGVVTEWGHGALMLLWEERFAVERGKLVSKGRKLLNPWYGAVVNAVRWRKEKDRKKFDAVCKAKGLWRILTDNNGVICERQGRTAGDKATVVLRVVRVREKEKEKEETMVTLHLTNKAGTWLISGAETTKAKKE